ncbi:MAG: acetyl-CoA hydrolase/transferase C-terminal domain-containing protein, partial [Dehalococcoidia bacterium]
MERSVSSVDWRQEFDRKLSSPEEAANLIQSGDHIWIPIGHASPVIMRAIAARRDELQNVQIRGLRLPDVGFYEEEAGAAFHVQTQFITEQDRHALTARTIDYHPYWMVGIHKALDGGRGDGEAWQLDKVILRVSPPNEDGYVNLGGNVWDGITSARRADCVIAEVNERIVETYGDTALHVSELDYIVPDNTGVMPKPRPVTPEAADEGIAHYVSTIVQDGDTIQLGVGKHMEAIVTAGAFDEKTDLSYFGELTVRGCVGLAESGVITGRSAMVHPNKFVATRIGNTVEEQQIIHRNPRYELYSLEYLLDPRLIAKNERMVAINGALSVDLSGQINVSSFGPRQHSGVGGHLTFALGAYLAPKGRYVCVLPSTQLGGTVSTIMAQFDAGQIVTVPRELADTVVTEYGIARLLGKSVRQRAEELISIAHPDFRAEL